MAEYTSNFNLEKQQGNEYVNIAGINNNFDIIDAEIAKKATTTNDGRMTKEDKIKIDGIALGANNYAHPSKHSPSIITQDENNRFVTDDEKAGWNGKLTMERLSKDANDIYQEIRYKRTDGTLFKKSVLSGGTSPKYTTRTVTYYNIDGITVKSTHAFNLTYTNDDLTSEVLV